jgi:hypothetical protein
MVFPGESHVVKLEANERLGCPGHSKVGSRIKTNYRNKEQI